MAKSKGVPEGVVSIRPNDMATGGGLLNNIIAKLVDCKYVISDYGGKAAKPKVCFYAIIHEVDPNTLVPLDDSDLIHEDQYWKCGEVTDWAPTGDGEPANEGNWLIPMGIKKQIHDQTNFGIFTTHLIECGFPEDRLGPGADTLNGLVAEFQQEDTGRTSTGKDGVERPQTVLCPSAIRAFPWDKPAKGKAAAPKGKGKSATKSKAKGKDNTPEDDGNLTEEVELAILDFLSEAPEEGLQKKDLARKIMAHFKGDKAPAEIKQAVGIAQDDEFLGDEERAWVYENGILSLG